ncbi:MAG: hypothetical protein IKN55_13220 [Oscillospiraceae bacterium]|nr:hypothetical protein [Oscillospiraceae bacterium]
MMQQKRTPARKPVKKSQKPALSPAQKAAANKQSEQIRGIVFPLVIGAVTALIVGLMMTFLFQNGLHWTDRCNCSWERVILHSILAFVACALQVFSYLSFREKKRQYEQASSPQIKKEYNKRVAFRIYGVSIIIAVVSALVMFLGVPLLQDQNGNFLWFVTKGMGIVVILVTTVMSAAGGIIDKVRNNNYVK